jgi:hypothetical protein
VLLGAGCSPHEFKDPTSATTEVLYTKPATLKPPADPPNTAVPGPILGTPSTSGPPQPATTLAPSKLPGATEESTRSARRDVLELVTGDRVEGAITQLTPTVVVIETGGQSITFGRDRVRSIQFAPR